MVKIIDPDEENTHEFKKKKPSKKLSSNDLRRMAGEYRAANQKFAELLQKSDQAMRNTLLAISGQIENMTGGLVLMPVQRKQLDFLKLLQSILQGKEIPQRDDACTSCGTTVQVMDIPLPPNHGSYCDKCVHILFEINQLLQKVNDDQRAILKATWDLAAIGTLEREKLKELRAQITELLKEKEDK